MRLDTQWMAAASSGFANVENGDLKLIEFIFTTTGTISDGKNLEIGHIGPQTWYVDDLPL